VDFGKRFTKKKGKKGRGRVRQYFFLRDYYFRVEYLLRSTGSGLDAAPPPTGYICNRLSFAVNPGDVSGGSRGSEEGLREEEEGGKKGEGGVSFLVRV
jgi:hypothetical protein